MSEDASDGWDDDIAALLTRKRGADEDEDAPTKRPRAAERNEAVPESTDGAGGGAKLRLADLVGNDASLSKVKALAERPASDGSQPVASKRGGGALQAPLPGVVQDRLERKAAYELSRNEVQGWAPTIKRLREAEHLSFPLQKPAQPPAPSNAGLTASFQPSTDMERSVAELLERGGLTEKQIAEQEGLVMRDLTPAEVAQRQGELRRMRELLFRAEQKARRANKIKSKTYRRIRRRERERQQQQLTELDASEGGYNDEERQELMEKATAARAKERATLRHRNTGQWAKLHVGRHDEASTEARQAIEDQLRLGDELRKRIHTEDSDESFDEDDENDAHGAAFNELEDFVQQETARDAAEKEAIKGTKSKSLFNMKFMQDARERQSRETQDTISTLRDALEHAGEDEDVNGDDDDTSMQQVGRIQGRAMYGDVGKKVVPKAPSVPAPAPVPSTTGKVDAAPLNKPTALKPAMTFESSSANPWLADEARGGVSRKTPSVLVGKDSSAATRSSYRAERHAARGSEARDMAEDEATLSIDPSVQMQPREADNEDSESEPEPVEVTKAHARGKRGRGKRATSTLLPMQRDLVAEAFAGDNVALDFAKEKRATVKADAPREEDVTLPGWGTWGGKGVRHKGKKDPVHVRKVAGLDPMNRKDRAMENVIINERLDKKAAKYKAKDLPYPYTSASQYEEAMRVPIGAEWNTRTQHQRMTLPRVTTKMGQRIDPIQRKF